MSMHTAPVATPLFKLRSPVLEPKARSSSVWSPASGQRRRASVEGGSWCFLHSVGLKYGWGYVSGITPIFFLIDADGLARLQECPDCIYNWFWLLIMESMALS